MNLPVFLTNPLFCLLIPSCPCLVFLFNDTVTSLLQTDVKCWVSLVFCVKLNMAWKVKFLVLFWGPLGTKCSIFNRDDTSNMPRCQHSGSINWICVLIRLRLVCRQVGEPLSPLAGLGCLELQLCQGSMGSPQPHSSKAGCLGCYAGFEFGGSEASWKELGKGSVHGLEDKWCKKVGKCFMSIK